MGSIHTSKSAENRSRKMDFTIFSIFAIFTCFERHFGGRNFKSAKQGQSVQKSRKSGFRDNTFYRGLIGQRIVSDTQKMFRGRFVVEKSIFQNPDFGPKRNF